MQTENLIGTDRVMDVRALPCSIKHGLIVKTFQELPVDQYFILFNGHDPVPLREQFMAQWPHTFTWEYLTRGPEEFRVKITKTKVLGESAKPVATTCDH